MKRFRLFGGLIGVASAGFLALGADKPKDPPKDEPPVEVLPATTQEVMLFSKEGPVRVKLMISVEKQTAEASWRAAVDALFDFCDRDGNGSLSAAERSAFVNKNNRNNGFVVVDMMGYQVPMLQSLAFKEDSNGNVSKAVFAAAFEATGSGSIAVQFQPAKAESQQLTDAMMKRIDTDSDGKLSASELKVARIKLAALDTNEDEWLSSQEILDKPAVQQYDVFVQPQMVNSPGAKPAVSKDFLVLKGADTGGVKQLIAAKDKDKDGALSQTELEVTDKFFAKLDVDGNKLLDADELAAWLRSPADIELRANLRETAANAPGDKVLQIARKTPLSEKLKEEPTGTFAVSNPDARLSVTANLQNAANARANWQNQGENLKTLFKLLSMDKDELDRRKLTENPNLLSMMPIFDFFDRNDDKKLTIAEIDAAVLALGKVINCRASVVVTDEGRGLFEVLDKNRDNRLSLRELANAPTLIVALDKDKDGFLALTEVTRSIPIRIEQSSINIMANNGGYAFSAVAYDGSGVAYPAVVTEAPEWFRKMDRNADGEVSAKEFLGSPAVFKKLDANGDGLISPDEAGAKKSDAATKKPEATLKKY